jgi:hypothetical protein
MGERAHTQQNGPVMSQPIDVANASPPVQQFLAMFVPPMTPKLSSKLVKKTSGPVCWAKKTKRRSKDEGLYKIACINNSLLPSDAKAKPQQQQQKEEEEQAEDETTFRMFPMDEDLLMEAFV